MVRPLEHVRDGDIMWGQGQGGGGGGMGMMEWGPTSPAGSTARDTNCTGWGEVIVRKLR